MTGFEFSGCPVSRGKFNLQPSFPPGKLKKFSQGITINKTNIFKGEEVGHVDTWKIPLPIGLDLIGTRHAVMTIQKCQQTVILTWDILRSLIGSMRAHGLAIRPVLDTSSQIWICWTMSVF